MEKLMEKREAKNNHTRLLGLDRITYPGTLGRFLSVQVLCDLGKTQNNHEHITSQCFVYQCIFPPPFFFLHKVHFSPHKGHLLTLQATQGCKEHSVV